MTTKLSDQVRAFHNAFGVAMRSTPGVPDAETVKLRIRLIGEEFCEFLDACGYDSSGVWHEITDSLARGSTGAVDVVGVADATVDMDVINEGTRLVFGIDGEPIADEVMRANMSKLGEDGKPVYRDDMKITKGPRYSPPQLEPILIDQGWQP